MYKENEMTKQNLQYSSMTTVQVRMALPSYHFKALLKEKYDKIQKGSKESVSITRIWEEMEKEKVSRMQFEDDLIDLEKKQVIVLQKAIVKEEDSKKAIVHPTRGILRAITWKK